jgi:hypothetical protein
MAMKYVITHCAGPTELCHKKGFLSRRISEEDTNNNERDLGKKLSPGRLKYTAHITNIFNLGKETFTWPFKIHRSHHEYIQSQYHVLEGTESEHPT